MINRRNLFELAGAAGLSSFLPSISEEGPVIKIIEKNLGCKSKYILIPFNDGTYTLVPIIRYSFLHNEIKKMMSDKEIKVIHAFKDEQKGLCAIIGFTKFETSGADISRIIIDNSVVKIKYV